MPGAMPTQAVLNPFQPANRVTPKRRTTTPHPEWRPGWVAAAKATGGDIETSPDPPPQVPCEAPTRGS